MSAATGRIVGYRVHRLARLFPAMTEGAFKDLVADIGANGQREPILIYKGTIVDGLHRARACEALGITQERWPKALLDELARIVNSMVAALYMRDPALADTFDWNPKKIEIIQRAYRELTGQEYTAPMRGVVP